MISENNVLVLNKLCLQSKVILDDSIQNCFREHCEESSYGRTFNPTKTIKYIHLLLLSNQFQIFLAYDSDTTEIAGYALVGYEAECYDEPFGFIYKFYVRKKFRGTYVGRKLIRESTKWLDAHGCNKSFVTSSAGIGHNKEFENLMSKFGYQITGHAMERTK